MIPKQFKKTTKLKEEYDNYMSQSDYEEDADEYMTGYPMTREEYKKTPDYTLKQKIKQCFPKEYKKLKEANNYFLGCPFNSYTSSYEKRLKDFKGLYVDAEEHNFIIEELDLISGYRFSFNIEDNLKKNIKYSLEKTINYLRQKLQSLGYKIENSNTKEGKLNSIAVKDNSIIKLDNEPKLDLSDSKPIDQIRYLGLIGFFDLIRNREPQLSTNQLASLISAITGIKQTTVQPYINPILSSEVSQKKNPFKNFGKVAEIKSELINIGITNIENL